MIHTDARFSKAVEDAVGEVERTTDAEVIVVAAERSGSYRDVAAIGASAATLLGLVGIVFMPWTVHPWMLPIYVAALWLGLAWVFSRRPVLRWVVSERRKRRQVEEAAHAEFHRESVHATPHRTGLLVYVSALEGRVEVVPDLGLDGRIPKGAWTRATGEFRHDDLDHFVRGLREIGTLLAEHVPALDEDLVDLPNAPRVRP